MKLFANVAVCIVQFYILFLLFARMRKARVAVWCIAIVSVLEAATTLYDIDGPGRHFPLEIRVPVLILEFILMLKAL